MNFDERMAKAREALGVTSLPPKTKCESGKGMYQTRELADAQAYRLRKRKSLHGEKLHSYHCKRCGWWHLTRQK